MKTCSRCKEEKSHKDYQAMSRSKDGKRPECKTCSRKCAAMRYVKHSDVIKKQKKLWYEKYKEKIMEQHREYRAANTATIYRMYRKYRDKNKDRIAAWWKKSPRGMLGKALQMGLARRHTHNAISLDELMKVWEQQEGKCAVSGLLMTWRQGGLQPTSISVDRIDGTQGYSKTNVRLVCYQVNTFRGRWSDEQMFSMAEAILSNRKHKGLELAS